ncbi:hypothetical protein B0H14DRAFT_3458913 [Mycena olivaceomarginata]|nr:hypothetical protein B0H14DRAFT_3458913 [Mycena olivaceomarginata]
MNPGPHSALAAAATAPRPRDAFACARVLHTMREVPSVFTTSPLTAWRRQQSVPPLGADLDQRLPPRPNAPSPSVPTHVFNTDLRQDAHSRRMHAVGWVPRRQSCARPRSKTLVLRIDAHFCVNAIPSSFDAPLLRIRVPFCGRLGSPGWTTISAGGYVCRFVYCSRLVV